jgi:hypothetical protein
VILAGQFGTGQVLWSILWLTLFVFLAWLFITLFADIVRSDLSGWAKAIWTFGLIVLPFVGALSYLIVHGAAMSRRIVEGSRRRVVDPLGGSVENERFRLSMLHDAGEISDADYAEARSRLPGEDTDMLADGS